MTLVLDERTLSIAPLTRLVRSVSSMCDTLARRWHLHRQAAILRATDQDTLGDIGFSADYIREEWQDFAADHQAIVALAAWTRSNGQRRFPSC